MNFVDVSFFVLCVLVFIISECTFRVFIGDLKVKAGDNVIFTDADVIGEERTKVNILIGREIIKEEIKL